VYQHVLEEAAGCYQGQISHVECGVRGISIERIEKIADYFGVDPCVFFQPEQKRQLVRSLFEGMTEEFLHSLRGDTKYSYLIDKLKNVIKDSDNEQPKISPPPAPRTG
jgi:transcriptional regulator with XRE-family HTH domain